MTKGNKSKKVINGRTLRKACVRLSISTNTSLEFYLNSNFFDLAELGEEVKDVMKK